MAGGHATVVQGRKEGGGEDVEARQQEGEGEQPEGVDRQGVQVRIITHENMGQRLRQSLGQRRQDDAADAHEQDAFSKHIFQFPVIFGTVVEADDRGTADGIAYENGDENKLDVHQHAVSGNAVFPVVAQQLEVIENAHQGGGNVAHQLRGAVGAGPENGFHSSLAGRKRSRLELGRRK